MRRMRNVHLLLFAQGKGEGDQFNDLRQIKISPV